MATPSQNEEWLPKQEAAALLGVSTREIERKAASGRIRTSKVRLQGDRSDRTVYSSEDVLRVKQERESGVLQLARQVPASPVMGTETLAAIAAALRPESPRVYRAWLTLEEAADYSGLPASTLAELVRTGQVYALGRGAKTWRVQRSALDKWSTSEFDTRVGAA